MNDPVTLVSLLDESAFLNESLEWFKDKYILKAQFLNYKHA